MVTGNMSSASGFASCKKYNSQNLFLLSEKWRLQMSGLGPNPLNLAITTSPLESPAVPAYTHHLMDRKKTSLLYQAPKENKDHQYFPGSSVQVDISVTFHSQNGWGQIAFLHEPQRLSATPCTLQLK